MKFPQNFLNFSCANRSCIDVVGSNQNFVYHKSGSLSMCCMQHFSAYASNKPGVSRRDSRWQISLIRSPPFVFLPFTAATCLIYNINHRSYISLREQHFVVPAMYIKLKLIKLNEFNFYSNKLITTLPLGIDTRLARRLTSAC